MADILRVRIPDKEKAWHPNRPHVLAGTTLALRRSQLKERLAIGLTADWVISSLTPQVTQVSKERLQAHFTTQAHLFQVNAAIMSRLLLCGPRARKYLSWC